MLCDLHAAQRSPTNPHTHAQSQTLADYTLTTQYTFSKVLYSPTPRLSLHTDGTVAD